MYGNFLSNFRESGFDVQNSYRIGIAGPTDLEILVYHDLETCNCPHSSMMTPA